MNSHCFVCHKVITLTKDGLVRVHGPVGNRCSGSRRLPVNEAAITAAVTRAVLGKLSKTTNVKTPGECLVESIANGVLYLERVGLVHAFRVQLHPKSIES